MLGHLGFSYIGLIFLLLLFIPNIIWTRKKPQGYIPENENKVLLILERIGQALSTVFVLIFNDSNLHGWSNWTWWLIAAFMLMTMYELWWVRYFRSEQKLSDFYSSFLGVPLAGSTLPVIYFFLTLINLSCFVMCYHGINTHFFILIYFYLWLSFSVF